MRQRIKELFEAEAISPQPHLEKNEVGDEQFQKVLAAKPGDINTLLARCVSMIKDDDPNKTKGQIIEEILEVLDRSIACRIFLGVGVNSSYHLYKGIPVRMGEKFSKLPSQGDEIQMDRAGHYQSWTTEVPAAREIATTFDPAKGEPVGGMLVDSHVNAERLYFDVNAAIKTCKIKMEIIRDYNLKAAQGKAISVKNVDFLATKTEYYHGIYEVLTDPNVVNVRVVDTWSWDESTGTKIPQWKASADAKQNPANEPVEPEKPETLPQQTKPVQNVNQGEF